VALDGTSPADTRQVHCSLVRAGRTWAASLDVSEPAARLEELIGSSQSAPRKVAFVFGEEQLAGWLAGSVKVTLKRTEFATKRVETILSRTL
jgi:hypothetical protein